MTNDRKLQIKVNIQQVNKKKKKKKKRTNEMARKKKKKKKKRHGKHCQSGLAVKIYVIDDLIG